jgi:hypothetical protein
MDGEHQSYEPQKFDVEHSGHPFDLVKHAALPSRFEVNDRRARKADTLSELFLSHAPKLSGLPKGTRDLAVDTLNFPQLSHF